MRIIVLVDFSLYTTSLLKVASNWADLFNAKLILVHEVPRLVPAMADDNTRANIIKYEKEEAISRLETLVETKIPDHISTGIEVTDLRLKYFLPQYIPKKEQTFILLGLKGTGLLKKVFIGSVATEIINELNKITIGIPLKVNQTIPENLIIPVNPDYNFNEEKLDQLLGFLHSSLKNIDFISIDRSGEQGSRLTKNLEVLAKKFGKNVPVSTKLFRSNDEFKSYTIEKENSMIVLQKGGDSFKDMVLKRFFINKIVHDGSIPLIVLPE